jgi:hypothetical protein
VRALNRTGLALLFASSADQSWSRNLEPEVRIPSLWDWEIQTAQPCDADGRDADPPEHPFSMKSLERLGFGVSSTP